MEKTSGNRYLVVHGYWWGPDTHLAKEHNRLVLDRVWAMASDYDKIILVHGYGPLDGRTLAEVQYEWLVEEGIPREKLLTQKGFGITDFPPLDTWEEVALARKMIQLDGADPRKVSVDVIGMHWHMTRIWLIYWWAGIHCQKLIRINGPYVFMRLVHELVGFLVALCDPNGQNPLLKRERRKRKEEILERLRLQKSGE